MPKFSTCFLVFLVLAAAPATAQVPPHTPGTICLTPDFWCWASVQGVPGEPCECAASDPAGAPVAGVYG